MLASILAAAERASEADSNSAWIFVKKNFINAEFYASHMEIHIHYGTVALIVATIFFMIVFKIQRRRPPA